MHTESRYHRQCFLNLCSVEAQIQCILDVTGGTRDIHGRYCRAHCNLCEHTCLLIETGSVLHSVQNLFRQDTKVSDVAFDCRGSHPAALIELVGVASCALSPRLLIFVADIGHPPDSTKCTARGILYRPILPSQYVISSSAVSW